MDRPHCKLIRVENPLSLVEIGPIITSILNKDAAIQCNRRLFPHRLMRNHTQIRKPIHKELHGQRH
jgi:hypothetical protein